MPHSDDLQERAVLGRRFAAGPFGAGLIRWGSFRGSPFVGGSFAANELMGCGILYKAQHCKLFCKNLTNALGTFCLNTAVRK